MFLDVIESQYGKNVKWNDALDPDTSYRYYSLDQLARLHRILALKEMDFPLEQISHLLEEDLSLEQLRGMFVLKQAQKR